MNEKPKITKFRRPIEMLSNQFCQPQITKDDLSLTATFTEKIMSQVVALSDKNKLEYVINTIQNFMIENNVSTCFILNKEELIDCLQEHNKLHLQIESLKKENLTLKQGLAVYKSGGRNMGKAAVQKILAFDTLKEENLKLKELLKERSENGTM